MSEVRAKFIPEPPKTRHVREDGRDGKRLSNLFVVLFVAILLVGFAFKNMWDMNKSANALVQTQLARQSDDAQKADKLLYMSRLGMIKWMRYCAYISGHDNRTVAEMEKNCAIDLQIEAK